MSKQFWLVLLVIAAILGGVLVVTNHNRNAGAPATNAKPTEHIEGNPGKSIVLIEYGDYQCPICGEFYPAVKQVVATYNGSIGFQFRELPLTQIHNNAFAAARAAEAAGLQGKYFEMHDLLYENQNAWSKSSDPQLQFNAYAARLGLNLPKFKQDYASEQVNNAINADIAAFNKTGDEMATPTFYLDGKKLDNSKLFDASSHPSVAAFSQLIQAEIDRKTGSHTNL